MTRTIAVLLALLGGAAWGATPEGWILAGSNPGGYAVDLDTQAPYEGGASATLKAKAKRPDGFGTLMQTFDAKEHRGERLRLTAQLRAEDVQGWAGLWMRVDGPGRETLSFDNMQDRPLTGSSGWTEHAIVLDVPAEATQIALGVLLTGGGQVWVDALTLEPVPKTVPVTNVLPEQALPEGPENLDFEG